MPATTPSSVTAPDALSASAPFRGPLLGVATLLVTFLLYALLLDPADALMKARVVAVRLTMVGLWATVGAMVTILLTRRRRAEWRLVLAIAALAGTALALFARGEIYAGRVVPDLSWVFVPFAVGALAAWVLMILDVDVGASAESRRLRSAAIAVALLMAAPIIASPIIQHWNASGWMDSHSYDVFAHDILSGKARLGGSAYMPVYQYGMAAVYYVFGHFFFAQQLVNGLLSFGTTLCLCLAAWNVFRSVWAVALIGVWAAITAPLHDAVFLTQIESWYLPIVALGILLWTCYWRTPSTMHLVLMAAAAAVGINTRNQGAFYFGWLCLAPLFAAALPWRRRLFHAALAVALLAASLLPWSIRNHVVEGRFSPSAARNAYYVAVLNDPRIGFFGIRYWEGWQEISADYERKYPDPVERDRAMLRAGMRAAIDHPQWFREALFWRTLSFYGLLPEGILALDGPEPISATDWQSYVFWRMTPILFLSLSAVGLITRFGRTTLFLAAGVLAMLATTALTGGSEARVSYPALPLHMLIALAAFVQPRATHDGWTLSSALFANGRARTWTIVAVALAIALVSVRVSFGRSNLYAPLVESRMFVNTGVTIDQGLTSLNDVIATQGPNVSADLNGATVRLRLIAWNYQSPPKWADRVPYMPDFTTDPSGVTYYYASLLVPKDGRVTTVPIGAAWFGATVNDTLREGDEVEAEGTVVRATPDNAIATYWIRIVKAIRVARSIDAPSMPP